MSARDRIFSQPLSKADGFVFDEQVASVFPDMIQRSVPGYQALIGQIAGIARVYARPESRIYDLGCSLGAASLAIRLAVDLDGCKLIAVDNAPAMIAAAETHFSAIQGIPYELLCADICHVPVENASLVVMNYTLQFLPPEDRLAVLKTIHQGLNRGGVLVLSEKIRGVDAEEDALLTKLHYEFKRANGYSDLEISQKRDALEEVLIPDTLSRHRERLAEAGFQSVHVYFQALNFISLIAHP